MTGRAINLRAWPGRGQPDVWEQRDVPAERLALHPGLVLVAAAERYVTPERWGLGVAIRIVGSSVTGVLLVIEDDLQARDPSASDALFEWAASQRIDTPDGPVPVDVVTRRELCHPDAGVLTTTAYTGGGWLLTADEGRTLGLLAEWWRPAQRPRFRGGFTCGLPGWGEDGEWLDKRGHRHRGWRSLLHRPTWNQKAVGGHGIMAEWGKAGRGGRTPDGGRAGHWERVGRRWLPFRGRIVDLIGPAFTFDGLDTSELSEHLSAFGLPALEVPAAVTVDINGAGQLLDVTPAVHRLAVALDAEAARWFTTPAEQADGRAVVGLRHLVSPGSLAAAALRHSGNTPPLRKFRYPDDAALDRWAAAGHGGWVT